MDPERERAQADLRGLVAGEVFCDDLNTQMFASDASIFEIKPLGVVRPRSLADVVACIRYAAENGISIHPRGAGTGLAGEALGNGLVVDFSHSMRRVIDFGPETVRVQAGVVHAKLNERLAERGQIFGPDPATSCVSTIGSVLALDGSGSHWLRFGSARDNILTAQVVLADGEVTEFGRHSLTRVDGHPRRQGIIRRVAELLERNAALIEEHTPETCVNTSGYQLKGLLHNGELDLAKLLVGSEGTLGLITEAELKVSPLAPVCGVAVLFFDRLEKAAQGALLIAEEEISACDLMDRRLLALAGESDPRYDVMIPSAAEAMLLVEVQGDDLGTVREQLQQIVSRLERKKRLAFESNIVLESDEIDLYWQLAQRVVPTLYQLKGRRRALPFVEDIAIPPVRLPEFLTHLQNVFKQHEITTSLFSHAAHGQLHIRPLLDLANPAHTGKMQAVAAALYDEVFRFGGTISGEHGDGLSRTGFVRRQYGPLYEVFRELKRIFDPDNILNPGKVVADLPQPLTKNLRPVERHDQLRPSSDSEFGAESGSGREASVQLVELQLDWDESAATYAARACNGCGRCRTELPNQRMCPIFRFSPREEASPRAKANLMRGILTGELDQQEFTSDELKKIADLCINCHQCRLECPAVVDIPKLMVECKAQHIAANAMRAGDWLLTRHDRLSALGSRFSRLANWLIQNRQMRWLLEKTIGIAQGRKLPRFSPSSFLKQSQKKRLARPVRQSGQKVLFFVDSFANWHDVELAEAIVAVLEHNGVTVYVPPTQKTSGMAHVAAGSVASAQRIAEHNIGMLAEGVRQGYHIVTAEPTSALCLQREYRYLFDNEDAQLVAKNVSDACAFLWQQHQIGKLELDLKPVNATVGYHQPCHSRALECGSPGEHLLRLIPGLVVQRVEKGCSGMAGTFGLKHTNYRSSLRAGWGLISALRESKIQMGATECSSCKMQMEQGTTKPTIHPLKILALSYGLRPAFAALLTARGEELIVT